MPSLHAGYIVCRRCAGGSLLETDDGDEIDCPACRGSGRTTKFYRVTLTQRQMRSLGYRPRQRPRKLGAGMDACAYEIPGSDSVVKITKDKRDAVAAFVLRKLDPFPLWAIPIRGVYRLKGNMAAIVVARADVPLPPKWSDPIQAVFDDTDDEEKWGEGGLQPGEWHSRLGYEGWVKNIELANIREGKNDERKHLRNAVDTINEMMLGLFELGLDGSDFHPGNWGIYQGRPVLIDFGMDNLPDDVTEGRALRFAAPPWKQIPVLPF